jgi:phosphate transport system protein
MKMPDLSMHFVDTAIELYETGDGDKSQLFEWSEELRVLQDEVTEFAVELISRYQPVAHRPPLHQILYGNFLWFL